MLLFHRSDICASIKTGEHPRLLDSDPGRTSAPCSIGDEIGLIANVRGQVLIASLKHQCGSQLLLQ
jgi:hypothetical protein